MKYRLKHWAEYAALRGVCGVIGVLPYRGALCLAWGLAAAGFWLGGGRRREAVRRILQVMGEGYGKKAARAAAWMSWRNTAFMLAEVVYMGGGRPRALPVEVDMAGALESFRAYAAANPGRGGIFACPHMGNWELAGLAAPRCGIRMFTITGVQKNPLVNDYFQRLRHAPGLELIPRGSANILRKVLANLREGKFLAIMPDLRSKAPGIPVQFFGGEANLYPGTGQFARQAGVPVFLAVMRRKGWTGHSMELLGPFEPDERLAKGEDVRRLSQEVMTRVDAAVRADPGQWFWFNKRWILDPLETP